MIVCEYCAHHCHLKEGQKGHCGVNQNDQGTLKTLVYNHPQALHVDPIEKKPLYHFLPGSTTLSLGTIGCNFVCDFCQNWSLSQEKTFVPRYTLSPQDVVHLAQEKACASIACTYNEPTIFFPYARDIGLCAKEVGLKNIWVSNGFASKHVMHQLPRFLDGINVDLKCFSASYYKTLGGRLDVVLDNLVLFKTLGIWLEVTTLLIPTKNDSEEEIRAIARFIATHLGRSTPWHISAFHPDYKQTTLPRTPAESLRTAREIGKAEGLEFIYIGNTDADTTTYCPACQTPLIARRYFQSNPVGLRGNRCVTCNTPLEGVFYEH